MKLYDVPGYDRPLLLSEDHGASLQASTTPDPGLPARNASADLWRDYAATQGADREWVGSWTRAELIAAYGS